MFQRPKNGRTLIVTVDLNTCKPCPFCGSHDLSTNGHGAYTIVVCCECLAEGPHGHPSKAISRWNTRTCAEIDMVTLSRSDLENSYNKLREALMEIAAGSPFVGWMDDNPLSDIESKTFAGMEDGYFIASEAARRALGGSNEP